MARLIQKTGFISRKSAGGYMKYIATREDLGEDLSFLPDWVVDTLFA